MMGATQAFFFSWCKKSESPCPGLHNSFVSRSELLHRHCQVSGVSSNNGCIFFHSVLGLRGGFVQEKVTRHFSRLFLMIINQCQP